MENYSFNKYYRVYKNGTAVTERPKNDFKVQQVRPGLAPALVLSLPSDDLMFYEYNDKIKAMEKAKSGALAYINTLINDALQAIGKLKKYRDEHYEDLNTNLVDSNIRRLEREMGVK